MEVGIDRSSGTRNDGITVRKLLLWHLTIYNVAHWAMHAVTNAKVGLFLL